MITSTLNFGNARELIEDFAVSKKLKTQEISFQELPAEKDQLQ